MARIASDGLSDLDSHAAVDLSVSAADELHRAFADDDD